VFYILREQKKCAVANQVLAALCGKSKHLYFGSDFTSVMSDDTREPRYYWKSKGKIALQPHRLFAMNAEKLLIDRWNDECRAKSSVWMKRMAWVLWCISFPLRSVESTIIPDICLITSRQPIELESCSNPLKMREVFQFRLKINLGRFGFELFWSDVTTGIGQMYFWWRNRGLSKNSSNNMLVFSFKIR